MEDSLIAFRTRSKMPLKDVPLGQLEAELQAPDITPDMYDPNTADDEDWKVWLGGLLNDDVENEGEWFCLQLPVLIHSVLLCPLVWGETVLQVEALIMGLWLQV